MKGTIKSKVRKAFVKIIVFSFILSLLTLLIWTWNFNKFMNPANYYEREIPRLVQEILDEERDLSLPSNAYIIEEMIPEEGIEYQLLDMEGKLIYGSIDKKLIEDKISLKQNINRVIDYGNRNYARLFQ